MMTDFLKDFEAALAATQSATQGDFVGGGGGVGEEMGVYDHMLRPSLGHQMQVELRESIQNYNGNRSSLQEQLSELCFNLHNLYTSPHPPPSPAPSTSSVQRWQDPNSQFSQAPEKAAHRARLAKLCQDDGVSSLLGGNKTEHKPKVSKDGADSLDHPGRRNTLLPPINSQDLSSDTVPDKKPEEEEEDAGGAAAMPEKAHPVTRTCLKNKDTSEKKALRFGASVELKTPTTKRGMPSTKGGKSDRKKTVGRKSSLKDKPSTTFLKLPTVYDVTRRKRFQWDSGKNHVHPKGKSTALETSQVREDCQTFSRRSVHLPPVQDRKRVEVRYSRPLPRGLTKARLQAASRLQKPLTVLCTESTPVNEGPRSSFGISESFSILPAADMVPELDDGATVLTTSDDVEGERGGERLELPPLPVVRLSESKLSGHGLQATTRHVPRLRLDRAASPGLQSVTTTGRSGATGLTAATYMSHETLEWKEEYMATGSRTQRDRMLSEIVQIVRQRMRENEEDLKEAGHDPRPSDLQSLEGDEDVRFWDRNVGTPNSGIVTGRSTTRRQLQRKLTRRKKQQATTGGGGASPESRGAKLHTYLQKLSQKRKATKQRPARDRVRFQLTNMTIREITQSSIGYPSSLHTATHTPLAA